ncbi:MAG: bifunctional DNA primase/polymerase [Candidatus Brocadiales bacterium]
MSQQNLSTGLEYAIYYKSKGLSVIPLVFKHVDKKPLVSWTKYQHRHPTEEELQEWFGNGQLKNIAIITGAVSGVVVLDFDTEESIKFAKKLGLPPTPFVKTARGCHAYFRYKDGIRNFQKRDDLPGIDLRGDGGYVVAPPSIHATGHEYHWVKGRGLEDLPLADFPEMFLVRDTKDKKPLVELYKGSTEGNRNDTLARLVGSWANDRLTFEECLESALLWNEKNTPPLPEKEVIGTVKSIFERHKEKPKNSIHPIEVEVNRKEFWKPVPCSQLSQNVQPIRWIWYGFVARGRITELMGFWKIGKTTLLLLFLRETAKGGDVAGGIVSQAKVLVISEEEQSEWAERVEEYGLADNVHVMCLPFKCKPSKNEWQEFLTHISSCVADYDLVIFDTLSSLWSVLNENDNAEVMQALMPLRRLTQQGVAVLLVHHSRKGDAQEGQASRGAGSLTGFVDILLEFRRFDPARENNRRVIKGYSRRKETPKELVIELRDGRYIALGTKTETTEAQRIDTILKMLASNDKGYTPDEIKESWGGELSPSKSTLSRDLESLLDKGEISRTGGGKKNDPYRYFRPKILFDSASPYRDESNFLEKQEIIDVEGVEVIG